MRVTCHILLANSLKMAKSDHSSNNNFDMQAATDPLAISMQLGEEGREGGMGGRTQV